MSWYPRRGLGQLGYSPLTSFPTRSESAVRASGIRQWASPTDKVDITQLALWTSQEAVVLHAIPEEESV